MSIRSLAAGLLALPIFAAACGGVVIGTSDNQGCSNPSPGMCAPGFCVDGYENTGQAACVDGAWVCTRQACSSDIDSGVSETGSVDGGSCDGAVVKTCVNGEISYGCCPAGAPCFSPPPFCDEGNGKCFSGACPANDAGTCNGELIPYCGGDGRITSYCCPPNADCAVQSYCDLGNGACMPGACAADAGAADACTKAISAEAFNQSCSTDADCSGVYSGSLCGNCRCPNDAINKSAVDSYNGAVAAQHPGVVTCSCPAFPPPSCIGGHCAIVVPD